MDFNEENRIAPKIPTKAKTYDDEDDDELTIDQLQILINQLNFQDDSGSYPKRLSALQSFLDYLDNHKIPPIITAQLQVSIIQIIQQENPPEINQLILLIINNIYKTFTDDIPINYNVLIGFIWSMLPSEEAFESLALIAYNNLEAAKIIIKNKHVILEWLRNADYINNALNLVNGLIRNQEIQTDFMPYVNDFLQLSQTLDSQNLPILYSILMHYTETKMGLTAIYDYGMIGTLFDRALENPDIFYAALCFVEQVNKSVRDPILFMEKANVLNFFEKSLNTPNHQIFIEGLNLCYSVAETKSGIQFMVENGIVDKLFTLLNSTFEISSFVLQIICLIVSECPTELIPQFLEKNLIENIILYLPNAKRSCRFQYLRCLETIVNTFRQNGKSEYIEEIATVELEEVLSELKDLNSIEDRPIQTLAHWVYSLIFHQE